MTTTAARSIALTLGFVLLLLVGLHPPWTAHAVVFRMSFRGFPKVPPTAVNDTVSWKIPFAALYSSPSLDLPPEDLAGYQRRLAAGDVSAAREWRSRVEATERRYRVPPKLRSVWLGDPGAGGIAFRRSIISIHFEVDRSRLAVHLFAIGVATALGATLASQRRTGSGGTRG